MFVKILVAAVAALAFGLLSNAAFAAGPQVVAGPGAEPACFAPWGKDVKYFQWPKKRDPTGSPSSTASSPTSGAFR